MTLTPELEERLYAEMVDFMKTEVKERIDAMKLEELVMFSPAELCGKFNLMPVTLSKMKIRHVNLTPKGKAVRYRLSDVKSHLDELAIKGEEGDE